MEPRTISDDKQTIIQQVTAALDYLGDDAVAADANHAALAEHMDNLHAGLTYNDLTTPEIMAIVSVLVPARSRVITKGPRNPSDGLRLRAV